MSKHRGPNWKTAAFALKRRRFTYIHHLLPLKTEEATGKEKNKMLPRWAAQHKPYLTYRSPQSKQTSSRTGSTGLNCFLLRVCLTKHTLMPFPYTLFSFYFDIWSNKPFFDIKKFSKYLVTIVDLFVAPLHFVLFLSLYFFCHVLNL
jgi:hypothetical protein